MYTVALKNIYQDFQIKSAQINGEVQMDFVCSDIRNVIVD